MLFSILGLMALAKNILKQFLIWTAAVAFWTTIREAGINIDRPYEPSFYSQVVFTLSIGAIIGLLFGAMETYLDKELMYKLPFGKLIFFAVVTQLIIVLILILIGRELWLYLSPEADISASFMGMVLSAEGGMMIFYSFIVSFLSYFFKQINQKFGPGNLAKMITGKFYHPKEDERIFMFLDLQSSTTYAEKLGHIKFSELIQDCFLDLSIVVNYGAEIYQYVGDEAILSWDVQAGLENDNCLRTYFEYNKRIEERSAYYKNKYGFVPLFKAGLNVGKVTIAEVGHIKREIAFHGDTLNTGARIQGKCNEFKQLILISENLNKILSKNGSYKTALVGNVPLRGKQEKVNIYSVSE